VLRTGIIRPAGSTVVQFGDPSDISGLNGWWKADSLSLADGDPVTTWTDSSGSGYDLTEATLRPSYQTNEQNGLPAVRFDGVDDRLENASFPADASATFFVVARGRSTAATGERFVACRVSSVQAWLLYTDLGATWSIKEAATRTIETVDVTLAAAVITVKTVSISELTSYYNGAAGEFGTVNESDTWTTATGIRIGARGATATAYASADVFEIVSYDSALSDADRQNVEGYLMDKWGIS
jgi:hypothetical protein